MATGYGLIPVRKKNGGEIRVSSYVVPASDSTALYVGDAVKLAAGVDTATQLLTIVVAATGDALIGSVVGFLPDPTLPYNTGYRAASTRRVVLVCDDPDTVFSVQEDAVGGAVSAANVGAMFNADVIVAAGSTQTALSGHMLDSSTAAATSATLKIVGVVRDNSGNAAAQTAGAKLEVVILEHALRAIDSIT